MLKDLRKEKISGKSGRLDKWNKIFESVFSVCKNCLSIIKPSHHGKTANFLRFWLQTPSLNHDVRILIFCPPRRPPIISSFDHTVIIISNPIRENATIAFFEITLNPETESLLNMVANTSRKSKINSL